MKNSFVAQVLKKALTDSGTKKIAHVRIPQVGPTLNAIKRNRNIGLDHKVRNQQRAALLQSLPSEPSDPETTTDWEPQQSTIWTLSFKSADFAKTIPPSILKSSLCRNVSGLLTPKRRSSKSGKRQSSKAKKK